MSQPPVSEEFIRQLSAHHNALLAFITSLLGNYERASDVLQETHVEMWRKAGDFEPGTNFFAWACAIARFKVLEARSKQRRDRLIFDDDLVEVIAVEAAEHEDVSNNNRAALDDCLEQLSPRQRELIRDRYAAGGSVKQLAKTMGRTAQSLGVTLFRIRQSLLDCVQRKTEATQ